MRRLLIDAAQAASEYAYWTAWGVLLLGAFVASVGMHALMWATVIPGVVP